MELSRKDMMDAVARGICDGIVKLGTSEGRFDIPHELFYDAIRQGAKEAVWHVANNATQAPSADFYAAIRDGVEAAMDRVTETCVLSPRGKPAWEQANRTWDQASAADGAA
jgi:hypothetical protein